MALGLWIRKEKTFDAIDMKGPNINPVTLKKNFKKGNILFMSRNVNRLLQKQKVWGEKLWR
jgi:hypothetical protein